MTKELDLAWRAMDSAAFTLTMMITIGLGSIRLFAVFSLMAFVVSFFWQYVCLHPIVRRVPLPARRPFLRSCIGIAFGIGFAELFILAGVDVSQGTKGLQLPMTIYLCAMQMLIGATCTLRAFARHKAI